jgi:hypothetical protein
VLAGVADFGWFWPWLPWWSLAPYWIVRELVLSTLFVIIVRVVWSTLTTGRQVCVLLAFLLTSHLVLLLTYAAISGGPGYLGDGATQDWFLMQLWFKVLVGILVFCGIELWSRRGGDAGKSLRLFSRRIAPRRISVWLRRIVCVLGGGAAVYVAVSVWGVVSHGTVDESSLTRWLAIWSPIGGAAGCLVGALVVLRAERLEAR